MVSGYDKNPPQPRYQPDLGPGGNFFLYALATLILVIVGRTLWGVFHLYL